jgi:hypothetical protein
MNPARVRLRPAFAAMALGCFTLFLAVPLAVAVAVIILAPANVSAYVAAGAVLFAALVARAMSSSYQWVELDGGVIRGRKLLTRRLVEKQVADIVSVKPLNSAAMGAAENFVLDATMGTSNRGYELHFRDGSKLGLVRGDMAGLDEFLRVLAAEIAARCGPLEE